MRNIIELYKVLRGHTDEETLTYLVSEYRQEIIETAMDIKHTDSTRRQAVESYKKICNQAGIDGDYENGIMCDKVSAVSLAVSKPNYNTESSVFKFLSNVIKMERVPYYLKDSIDYAIATAKVNGWKIGDTNFTIRVGENRYNLTLVARIFNMIADKRNFNDCDLFLVGADKAILMLRTQYGFGVVLPVMGTIGTYDVTPGDSKFDEMIKEDKVA